MKHKRHYIQNMVFHNPYKLINPKFTFGELQFSLGNTLPPSILMAFLIAESKSGKLGSCNKNCIRMFVMVTIKKKKKKKKKK